MKYNYYAVFEKEKDGKYSIYYPDLPGCFSCGDNMEEALYMAKDALEGYLLISEEDNEFIREPSTYYELDKNLKEELDILCDEIGITVTTAFTIFAKKFVRERRLPFTIDADPFYSQKNLTRLKKSIEQLENKGGTIHEITEVLDD